MVLFGDLLHPVEIAVNASMLAIILVFMCVRWTDAQLVLIPMPCEVMAANRANRLVAVSDVASAITASARAVSVNNVVQIVIVDWPDSERPSI